MTYSLDDGLGEGDKDGEDDVDDKSKRRTVVLLLQYGVVQHSWYWSDVVILTHGIVDAWKKQSLWQMVLWEYKSQWRKQ